MTDGNSEGASGRAAAATVSRVDALAVLPIFFKLDGRGVVLAGGSEPALWKAELLSAAGAHLDVYAETFVEGFEALALRPAAGRVRLHRRRWQADDLADAVMAVGAIDDDGEARRFVTAAKAAGAAVNVIDRPEFCAFQFGSIVNRSPLVISISTDGAAPVFGQAVRSRIEALLPAGFKRWAEAAKTWRREGDRLGADTRARRRFWSGFADFAFERPEHTPTCDDLEHLIAAARTGGSRGGTGFVSLVGAGPGDPELLTLKAVRTLRAADAVLFDALVTAGILDFCRREAERIPVGKTGYGAAVAQKDINALIVKLAREGKRVVRLKAGDPLVFGRAGEEIAALDEAGIDFEIVPGISAGQAAAASLKASLTGRDQAKRVQFATGHSPAGALPDDLDWQALADPVAVTVIYMGLATLSGFKERLLEHGLPASTPAYALFNVSRDDERIIRSTIDGLPEALAGSDARGACLIMYGAGLGQRQPTEGAVPSGAAKSSPA